MKQRGDLNLVAISQAPAAKSWLATTKNARVVGSFNRAFNLVNENGDFLSVLAPDTGNAPFAILLADAPDRLQDSVGKDAIVSIRKNSLVVNNLTIDFSQSSLWHPRPDWDAMKAGKAMIVDGTGVLLLLLREQAPTYSLASLITMAPSINEIVDSNMLAVTSDAVRQFCIGLANRDPNNMLTGAQALAGLGLGLTPAGDDFLLGALHALWAISEPEQAARISEMIVSVAAPRTTHLSAAWMRAAARGEASERWHKMLGALYTGAITTIERAAQDVMAIGNTSGTDALTGFVMAMQPNLMLDCH